MNPASPPARPAASPGAAANRFVPTHITLHPPPHPDALGTAIVRTMRRNLSHRLTLNLPATLGLGLATAGLGPLVLLLLRLRYFATAEKFQLEHATEWVQTRGMDADKLHEPTRQLARGWRAVVMLGLVAAVGALAAGVVQAFVLRQGVASLWCFYAANRIELSALLYPAALSAGYLILRVALEVHARQVRRFAEIFNTISELPAAPPAPVAQAPQVAAPHESSRRRIDLTAWIAAGAVLVLGGAFWSLPMMLAAGVQRRYMKDTSAQRRIDIAGRIHAVLQPQHDQR